MTVGELKKKLAKFHDMDDVDFNPIYGTTRMRGYDIKEIKGIEIVVLCCGVIEGKRIYKEKLDY